MNGEAKLWSHFYDKLAVVDLTRMLSIDADDSPMTFECAAQEATAWLCDKTNQNVVDAGQGFVLPDPDDDDCELWLSFGKLLAKCLMERVDISLQILPTLFFYYLGEGHLPTSDLAKTIHLVAQIQPRLASRCQKEGSIEKILAFLKPYEPCLLAMHRGFKEVSELDCFSILCLLILLHTPLPKKGISMGRATRFVTQMCGSRRHFIGS